MEKQTSKKAKPIKADVMKSKIYKYEQISPYLLRDYFAGIALQAMLSRKDLRGETDEDMALNAYEYADMMLDVRLR
jgi:hypothetical protein